MLEIIDDELCDVVTLCDIRLCKQHITSTTTLLATSSRHCEYWPIASRPQFNLVFQLTRKWHPHKLYNFRFKFSEFLADIVRFKN